MKEKRKGYNNPKAQLEANKRYLASKEGAKDNRNINNYKSAGKNFILNYASQEDLEKFLEYIKIRKEKLKKEQD